MLDQLIKLVEQNAGEAIVRNKAVPNQFNKAAIEEVARQMFSGMQTQVNGGDVQQFTSMFGGGNMSTLVNNPMVAQIISNIAENFASKFGVSQQTANSIAGSLIPQIMNQFVNKTNDPNDRDFDLQDILRGFTGNNKLDVTDVLGGLAGSSSQGGSGSLGNVLGNILGGR